MFKISPSLLLFLPLGLGLPLAAFSFFMAGKIAAPKSLTLEEEKAWLLSRDLYGSFDCYEKEAYVVEGKDGYKLHTVLVKNPQTTDKYVILSHGFRSNRYGDLKYLNLYMELGFHCIIYDLRGHGENASAPITLGQRESADLLHLIRHTMDTYHPGMLGLHGESMGAATSLMTLKEHPPLDFVVADCSFANLYSLIEDMSRHSPQRFLLPLVRLMVQARFGFDIKKSSPGEAVKENTLPLLLIHGEADTYIPPEHSQRIQEANRGPVKLVMVPGAAHARSRQTLGKEAYQSHIKAFLKEMVP